MQLARPLVLGLLGLCLFQAGCDTGGDASAPVGSLLNLVQVRPETSTTAEAVERTPLQSTLRSGDFTFFAPNEFAWERLGIETASAYLGQPAIVEKVLRRHIVPGTLTADDLVDGATLQPLEGPPLVVAVDDEGGITVNGAEVVTTGITATNGVVHLIDRVVRDHLRTDERFRVVPLLSTLQGALSSASLTGIMADPAAPVTVFAPINSAFAGMFPESTPELLAVANRSLLARVLRHHVVPGRIQAEELQDGQELRTLEGDTLRVRREGRLVYVGDARLVFPDVETGTGTFHLVDDVLRDNLAIVERVRLSPSLVWLEVALSRAGIDAAPFAGPATLFAPTAEAIQRLGPNVPTALHGDIPLLKRVTSYGFVEGRYLAEDLAVGRVLTTAEGTPVTIQEDPRTGGLRFDEGSLETLDIKAADGVIHLVGALPRPPLDVWETLLFADLLAFREAARRIQLAGRLSSEEPVTVFAPPSKSVEDVALLLPQHSASIQRVVQSHLVEGTYLRDDLVEGMSLPTFYPGVSLRLEEYQDVEGVVWHADGVSVVSPVLATNGVVWFAQGLLAQP